MSTQQPSSDKPARSDVVTTDTGRIMRIDVASEQARAAEAARAAASNAVIMAGKAGVHPPVIDPARRTDVLFRKRRDEGQEANPWWNIGAFIVTAGIAVLLLGWIPGGA